MTIEETKQSGYVTLKEASERFGYSPDYIGQLIRKGKIEGKQVYSNLAWMTTTESIEEYISREKRTSKVEALTPFERILDYALSPQGTIYLTWGLKALLGILIIAALFVFYFLSIALDHKMVRDAERALAKKGLVAETILSEAAHHISYEK